MSLGIEEVQEIIDYLEGVSEKRIRAEERLNQEMEVLEGLGCDSIEEADDTIKSLDEKIEKRGAALDQEFSEFMDDYEELFNE